MTARVLLVLGVLLCGRLAAANPAPAEEQVPLPLRGIGIDAHLGTPAPIDLPFVDHEGKAVTLRSYLKAGRPVILTLNYYGCPTLCSYLLTGLMKGLRAVTFTPGKEFQVVTVSIDPKEGPELAAQKRLSYLQALGKETTADAWPFLTGKEADINRLAEAMGFHFRYDAATKQYAHSAGIFVLTPEGRLSQVLYGIDFLPRDLRLSLVEASASAIGTPVDQLLLFCYHYDPAKHTYGPTAVGVMRIGGALTVILLSFLLLTMWRRERRAPVVAS